MPGDFVSFMLELVDFLGFFCSLREFMSDLVERCRCFADSFRHLCEQGKKHLVFRKDQVTDMHGRSEVSLFP